MSFGYVFEALKAHYRARGLTYSTVAKSLALLEATVKRIFSSQDCSLSRLEALCSVAQVDLLDLTRGLPHQSRLIAQLTREQERELVNDTRLLLVAVCAMANIRFEDIVRVYEISEAQCVRHLARLDKIGILQLLPDNRYRLLVARNFQWIPDGPITRWAKQYTEDYFSHPFTAPGEMLRIVNVRVSAQAAVALLGRMEQAAREYAEQHNVDAWLPLDKRLSLSLCLAARSWEPPPFQRLRRNKTSAPRKQPA